MQTNKNNFKIGLFAPADYIDKNKFQKAIYNFKSKIKNIEIIAAPNIFKKRGLFAGTVEQKLADIKYLIDANVDMLMAIKGGYGSARFIENLDYSKFLKTKISIMGYSYLTALLIAAYSQTKIPMFYGYMLVSDFYESISAEQIKLFYRAINRQTFSYSFEKCKIIKQTKIKKINGIAIAGCLSVLCGLAGTRFSKVFENNNILFLEDINEEPYKIDRMITHLKNADFFKNTKCLFVDFNNCKASEKNKGTISIKTALLEILGDYNFPIINFPHFGHRKKRKIIPIGYNAEINFAISEIKFNPNAK